MVNLEHKLTVDDLIVEYMIYKVKNGYEPSFLASEFIDFLHFFEKQMQVEDTLYESDKLFSRFFYRKNKSDWEIDSNFSKEENTSHMEITYSEKDNDYIIKANYKLSEFDRSVINTYFMDNGMGRFDDFKGQTFKIRTIIGEYLATFPKRKIDESIKPNDKELLLGKYIAANIIESIWNSYIEEKTKKQNWPRQCDDIYKYLFEIDLAEIIGVESIKKQLLQLYNEVAKIIAILYHQDQNLQISSHTNRYLAKANYDLISDGYEELMAIAFGEYKKSLDINLSKSTIFEYIKDYYNNSYLNHDNVKITVFTAENDNVKKLVRNIDSKPINN